MHLKYAIRGVHCESCGAVKTEAMGWADPGASFMHTFEQRVAYLAQQSNRTAVSELI